DYVGWMDF
nr:cholecystokinin 8 [Cavia porcellus]